MPIILSMRVLVVEDEKLLADALVKGLTKQGMVADVAYDGEQALRLLACVLYDVVVLDRDLPGIHGDQVCATIVRDYPETRVLMLTAASTLDERVQGFGLGADDYMMKPFDFPELVMRLRALERRKAPTRAPVLQGHGVSLDPFKREVRRGGQLVKLTPKEFAVLELLMEADGGVLSAEHILEKAWDANADPFTNAIRVTIFHLRKKLGEPTVIQTSPGAGYYFGE